MQWERIKSTWPSGSGGQPAAIFRAKVPGGWLVLFDLGNGVAPPAVFVPDASHEWTPDLY